MKTTLLKIIVILFLLFNNCLVYAQNNDKTAESKKGKSKQENEIKYPYFFAGGSLWLGFGSYTYVDVNLMFGSQLTKRLNVGISGRYQYIHDKTYLEGEFETSVYGGSVFSQFAVIEDFRKLFNTKMHNGILIHAEYEFLNTKYNFLHFGDTDLGRDRYWLYNMLLGGGYFQQMGKQSKAYILILWNLTPSTDNPYTYPQIRVGFNIGLSR